MYELADGHWKRLQAAERDLRTANGIAGEREVWEAPDKGADGDLTFQPC